MKQFRCEICGGTSIIQIDERTYECQDCGLQYDIAEVEKLIVLQQENQVEELSQEELPTYFDSVGDVQSPVEIIEQSEREEQFEVVSDDETEEITILKPNPKIDFNDLYSKLEQRAEESDELGMTDENPIASEIDDNISDSDEVSQPKISANAMAAMNAFLEETAETVDENMVEEDFVSTEQADVEEIINDLETDDIVDSTMEEPLSVENNGNNELQDNAVIAIPWFKNLKVIIPAITGVALIGVLILLFILLPNNKQSALFNDETTSENSSADLDTSDLLSSSTNSSSGEILSSDKTETNGQNASEPTDSNSSFKESESKPSSSASTSEISSDTNGITYEKSYYPNGQIETIYEYSNGNITKCTQYYESGNILYVAEYANSNMTKYTQYYENGNIENLQIIKNDSSKIICYYENGKIESEREHKNDSTGKVTWYDENGNITEDYTYDNYGRKSGFSYYYNDDGAKNQAHQYKDDVHIETVWYQNDKKYCVGEYSNDKMVKATWYDENGNVTATETY